MSNTAQETLEKVDISQLSSKQLEKLLKQKQKEEKEAHKREKEQYEAERDAMVHELVEAAKQLHEEMYNFKASALKKFEDYGQMAKKYGDVRANSKGGYSLRTAEGTKRVALERNTINEFDERADMAAELIQEFLSQTVKKKDQRAYNMIIKLLARNTAGEFSTGRVFQLLQLKDEFNDERWDKAMQLMEEAYNNRPISYSLTFYEKNEQGKDEIISLSFPSIDVKTKRAEKD